MELSDVEKIKITVSKMNLCHENTLTYKAAVIILWCCENNTWNTLRTSKVTGYEWAEVWQVYDNLRKSKLLNGILYITEDVSNFIGFCILSMVGGGEIFISNKDFPNLSKDDFKVMYNYQSDFSRFIQELTITHNVEK